MSHFIIFDLEYTTWEGALDRGWDRDNEYREIVQLAALKVDSDTLQVIAKLDLLIKPTVNPILSDYFQQLTGIIQHDIDQRGLSFTEAYDQFIEFCKPGLVFSYNNDMFILGENAALNKGIVCRITKTRDIGFVNIAPYIHRIDPGTISYGSGRLWQFFNLPKPHEADEHDALFDCYSILAAIRHLQQAGHSLPL